MSKLKAKEAELDIAITNLGKASERVKFLTQAVKEGAASQEDLKKAISDLKNQGGGLKIVHAEAKILSGYTNVTFNDIAPKVSHKVPLLILISVISLAYLALA